METRTFYYKGKPLRVYLTEDGQPMFDSGDIGSILGMSPEELRKALADVPPENKAILRTIPTKDGDITSILPPES